MGRDDAILPDGQSGLGAEDDSDQLPLEDTLVDRGLEDVLDEGYSPPERPRHNHWGETALEEELGEPLDLRLSEEEPEQWDLPEREAREADRAGRLLTPVEETGSSQDVYAADLGIAGGAASAEEAAMHLLDGSDPREDPADDADEQLEWGLKDEE
jgi:hypothetical protein